VIGDVRLISKTGGNSDYQSERAANRG